MDTMKMGDFTRLLFSLVCVTLIKLTNQEVLNPPYFNIAEGRNITATETCGEKVGKEFFCKIIGSMWTENVGFNQDRFVHQGQACDYCDPSDPKKAHPAEYAIDGSPKWWQSPPLSRGPDASKVNLTIDLGQEFHVAYVYITMANSPRPGVWVLERSTDKGKTYKPWMYFADSREECIKQFGEESVRSLTRDDQVICETKYSKLIPLENGEMVISLLTNRPSGDNFTSSEVLQEFTKATNVRLRFIRPQTTFGHLLNVDQTVTRRYFYSIRDINIGGRCVCNGHAMSCDVINQTEPDKLYCACQHNTDGDQCGKCKPNFVQKRWQPATPDNPFVCEPCNCNGHSKICEFDEDVEKRRESMDIYGKYEGGGRCMHCDHNTTGVNCHECKFGYYRPEGRPLNASDVCVKCKCSKTSHTGGCNVGTGTCQCAKNFTNAPACDKCAYGYHKEPLCPMCPCYRNGTMDEICDPVDGKCECKKSYAGSDCSSCAPDYWGFPECKKCNCDSSGSLEPNCNSTDGQCTCKKQFSGRQCNSCSIGFYNYPECQACNCNPLGTSEEVCDQSDGKCKCKPGFGGERCDECAPGYFDFPYCKPCACNLTGSTNATCNKDGKCNCAARYGGLKCNQCAAGYFDFPKCEPCGCDPAGSYGSTCQNGVCQCRDNFEGIKCNKCKKNYYNYPTCESCDCNPAGVVPNFAGCSEIMSGKLCECKERVTGRYCDTCAPHYKNLRSSNPQGCEPCRCNRAGSINGLDYCDGESGQCVCKESVTGLACDRCTYGTYALSVGNYLGCVPCDCDVGGSWRGACDQRTGSCQCKYRIEGRRCDRPQKAHYFYTTYQYLYELEDGRGEYHNVRYDYNETDFPGFSWKGYAKFNKLQKKVIIDFVVIRSSFYRVIFNYHNPGTEPIVGNLTLSNENEPPQHIKVTFPPTSGPKKYLVPMDKTSPLYLFSAQRPWKAALSADEPLLVDYIVFLPQAYFEAAILRENVTAACTISTANYQLCRHYGYTKFPSSAITYPKDAAYTNADPPQDTRDSFLIDATLLSDQEREHVFDLDVEKSQKYVLVFAYVYRVTNPPPKGQVAKLTVEVNTLNGTVNIPFQVPMCQYTFPCRHIVLNEKAAPVEFHLESGSPSVNVKLTNEIGEATFGISGLVFLPKSDWHIDHVKPSLICVMRNLTCLDMSFDSNSESNKITFASQGKVTPVSTNGAEGSTEIQDRTIELVGTAPRTENYQIIVHYYQPDYPSFDIEATFQRTPSSTSEQATLSIAHCPSKSGCRSVVKFKKPLGVLEEGKEFTLILTPPKDRGVTLDYLLLTAEKSFSQTQLELPVVDRSTEFLRHCIQDAFYIDDSFSEFCKQALFTLTTGHNSGGAFCGCNVTGSKGYTCNPLGGQCDCKPNVIGRECKACRSDYYGFPDCKPCNCPPNAAYCEPLTGECVCPKNVVGAVCDKCAPLTFGYDSKMGCEKCNCHPTGVKDGNLQCDLNTGKCDCQDKYDGHACDSCKSGYFDFPVCRVCDCHLDGTKADICDRKSGMCDCKENVLRPNCNICRRGTYNLEKNNPQGCTKCFCFGTTENCKSSEMRIAPIAATNYSNWSAIKVTFTDSGMRINSIETESGSTESQFTIKPVTLDRGDLSSGSEPRSNIYFKLPNEFLGNRITSYGGFIRYEINESPLDGSANSLDTPITPDVIFIGRNSTIALTRDEQPESPGSLKIEIELLETKFIHLSDAASVTRAQLMTLLVDLQAVYIRGSYFEPIESVSLSSFQFDSVSNDVSSDSPLALRVEQCFCPANYKGSSCEECASGYYRIPTGPYLGSCIPCHCNGHSNECDPLTGKCFNCMHNTKGDHCELCNSGYYGNATIGRPDDCMMCPCPLPNNFAESCEHRSNSRLISEWNCNCKPGYAGQLCEICSAGHFGHPQKAGNYCQPCNCNGNIDPTDPGSCNLYSGECTKCLNNTAGKSCEYCADGYYGDAIELKNCMPCLCDDFGTAVCDRYSGKCDCHPNVIGESCDECKPNYWGFNSRKGCTSCNCSIASQDPDCDLESGQCRCQPGVTGRTCDACEVGFWKYSKSGCISCGCVEKYSRGVVCNQQTGKCECLPGVVGEKCDQCPWRWVFVDREGCLECGECQHALLNGTDALENDVLPMLNEFSNSSSVVFSKTSFVNFNNTESKLNKQLAEIIEASKTIDLSPLEDEMNKMANASDNLPATQEKFHKFAAGVAIKVEETKENATAVRRLIKKVKSEVDSLAQKLNATDYQFDIQANEESIKLMITQAEEKAKAIDYYNWKNKLDSAANESLASITVLEKVKDYISPYVTERTNLNNSKSQLEKIETTLKDANNKISDAIKVALDVERNVNLSRKSIKEMLLPKNDAMKNYESAISANLKEAKTRIDESDPILKAGSGSLETLVEISNRITAKKDSLSDIMFKPEDLQESGLLDKVKQATDHANFLNKTAADLDTIFVEAIRQGDLNRTMRAATAYEVIEKSIESAENSMLDVIQRISEKPGWDGIRDKIISTRTASTGNRTEGSTLRANITTSGSSKLKRYNETIRAMAAATAQKFEQLNKIEKGLEEIEVSSIAEPTRNVLDKAEESKYTADRVSEKFDRLVSDVNSLSNATKQLTEEERKAFIDIHESTSMTLLYGERGIAQKIREAMERVTKMVGSVESSKAKLKELKNSVIRARDMANRIDVAMKLTSGSFAELRKPQDLDSSGSYNKLSLNFATNSTDGLLAFIGNVRRAGSSFNKRNTRQIASTRETTDDYMALLLHEGKIRVALDLGSGPQFLETETRINDGSWGNLIVERIGKTLKITVNKDEKEIVTHGHIDGFSSVLDLNTQRSKIFIGSIPNQYIVPDTIKVNEFTGSLAYITLGDTPLGLLNFHQGVYLSGENLPNQPQVKGIHFNGLGWASTKIETDKLSTITNIVLTIKTYARSGLILLLSGSTDFLAIQLDNGQPKVIIDLGSGYVSIVHPKKVNDGNEHTIAFSRKFKDITLGVQGEETMSAETSGSQATFELDPTLYIGGHPGKHGLPEVSETPYEGCFNELGIEAKLIELGNATMMPGVTAGCLDSGVREAVFESNSPGYIAMPLSIEITEGVQISFKFRTNESNGLLFFAPSSLSSNPFSFLTIYISDGTLALRTEPGKTIESSGIRYDDNEWHYLMATKNAYQLRMDIDDKIEIALDSSDVLSISPGTFYIGGAPESLYEKLNSLQIPSNFVGCLGDAVVHDKFQDLKKAQSVVGATLVTCKIISDGKPRDSLPPPKSVVTVSSTTIEPTTETPEPPSLCHKPFKPVYPSWTIASTGRRFGTWQQSRAELKLSPEIINSFITESNVTLEFKTHELLVNPNGTRNDGVIFFLADAQYVDLFTLYMKQGSLFFAWNAGSGTETIGNVEKRLNMDDGKWHKITFGVKLKQGKLSLSNGETLTGTSPGGSSNLNIISPAYIGGLPPGVSERIKGLLEGVTNSFPGCVRNVVIGQKQFSFAESETENGHKFFNAPPCSEELEMGSFFPGQSNYLTCYDKFKVGASVEINFMIKPRNVSGLLLASFGVPDEKNRTTDYLIAKMVEGTIIVTVNNGAGAVDSQIKIKNAPSHTICDGKWHKVKIVKVQNAHYITVDEDSNVFEFGPGGVNVADTLTPLYVGDVPDKYRRLFPDLPPAYIGCMKNFKISRPLTQLDVRKTDLNWDCQNSGGIINLCPLI